jgi:hypothetical protein
MVLVGWVIMDYKVDFEMLSEEQICDRVVLAEWR